MNRVVKSAIASGSAVQILQFVEFAQVGAAEAQSKSDKLIEKIKNAKNDVKILNPLGSCKKEKKKFLKEAKIENRTYRLHNFCESKKNQKKCEEHSNICDYDDEKCTLNTKAERINELKLTDVDSDLADVDSKCFDVYWGLQDAELFPVSGSNGNWVQLSGTVNWVKCQDLCADNGICEAFRWKNSECTHHTRKSPSLEASSEASSDSVSHPNLLLRLGSCSNPGESISISGVKRDRIIFDDDFKGSALEARRDWSCASHPGSNKFVKGFVEKAKTTRVDKFVCMTRVEDTNLFDKLGAMWKTLDNPDVTLSNPRPPVKDCVDTGKNLAKKCFGRTASANTCEEICFYDDDCQVWTWHGCDDPNGDGACENVWHGICATFNLNMVDIFKADQSKTYFKDKGDARHVIDGHYPGENKVEIPSDDKPYALENKVRISGVKRAGIAFKDRRLSTMFLTECTRRTS